MTSHTIQVRQKGQLTVPSDLRRELGWEEGVRLVAVRDGDRLVLERPEALVARVAGSLAAYANPANKHRDVQEIIDEEREAFERAVVEDVLEELYGE